jgi:hypothetical protein
MRKLNYELNQAWIDLGYKSDMASGKLVPPPGVELDAFTTFFQLITQLPALHCDG